MIRLLPQREGELLSRTTALGRSIFLPAFGLRNGGTRVLPRGELEKILGPWEPLPKVGLQLPLEPVTVGPAGSRDKPLQRAGVAPLAKQGPA